MHRNYGEFNLTTLLETQPGATPHARNIVFVWWRRERCGDDDDDYDNDDDDDGNDDDINDGDDDEDADNEPDNDDYQWWRWHQTKANNFAMQIIVLLHFSIDWMMWTFQLNLHEAMTKKGGKVCRLFFTFWV